MKQSNSNNQDGNNIILPPPIGGGVDSGSQKTPTNSDGNDSANTNTTNNPRSSVDSISSSSIGKSLSSEELRDPNKIRVVISDKKSPIVILFGPPSCGKTMTLIRLTRYLKGEGYKVEPRGDFRPKYDENYENICKNFDTMINDDNAAASTSNINFMLARVLQNGRALCQILEGPGELYFDPNNPKVNFPAYLNTIINCDNRKVWLIMLEPYDTNSGMDNAACRNYVDKIADLKKNLAPKDKVIFVFNKIDKTNALIGQGQVNYSLAKTEANDIYPNIFIPFKNQNPITRLWKSYNCDFIAFQTGTFTDTQDGGATFQQGHKIYPEKLWKLIYKKIFGGWS